MAGNKTKPIVLKRSEIRKAVRKPPVRPVAVIPNKTKGPKRGRVRPEELAE